MKRSTLKDIAKLTGLSVSGVSRALKDHPDIAPETKEKVKEVAAALNYHPNPNAQFLHSKSSKIIAVILPEVNTFFFPELLQGISKVVEQKGYFLIFLQSDDKLHREKELIDYCIQMFVDGVLISVSAETKDIAHLFKLKEMGVPVLMIDRVVINDSIPYLTINDRKASALAVEHLISKGHRNIIGVFDDDRLSMTKLRSEGFLNTLQQNNINVLPSNVLVIKEGEDVEVELVKRLDEYEAATAVFTMSDKLMVRVYHVINSLGFKIPDDCALIAISDGKAPHYLYPGITHVRHSGEEVGVAAATLLFKMLSGENIPSQLHEVETKLVELGSV
ncbi:MAG: LacI family DNA-binding transcriptional regulator [Saprospiraceae bacterium]|nr:LacI family DNA-binding transcriptional regulator [Saprospiraceae bacterium]